MHTVFFSGTDGKDEGIHWKHSQDQILYIPQELMVMKMMAGTEDL
jgi:hypothetical protein